MNVLLNTQKIALSIALTLFLQLLCGASTSAQVIWASPTGSAWMSGSNWVGGIVPTTGQIAQFDVNPTSATTGIGINMDTASGSVSVGTIHVTASRTNSLVIGNSALSTPGTLNLTGATVAGFPSVILANFGGSATTTLTLQNTQGPGTSSMTLDVGTTPKKIVTGIGTGTGVGNTINVSTVLSGSGGLTFLGGGTWDIATLSGNNGGVLRLGGSNTFSGGISVGNSDGTSSGILELDGADVIANTTGNDITINTNSQLFLKAPASSAFITGNVVLNLNGQGNNVTLGALVNQGSFDYTWPGQVNLASDASIAVNGSATNFISLSGSITGGGQLIKLGVGNLVLSGTANTWSGGTVVTNGKLTVNAGSSLSSGPLVMGQLGGPPPSLSLNNTSQTVSSLSSTFSATSGSISQIITLASGTTLTVNQSANTTFGNGSASTLRSFINGSGALVKAGTGTLTFNSSGHSFTGGLNISGGELRFSTPAATAISLNTCPVTLNGGTLGTSGIGINTTTFLTFSNLTLTDNSVIDLDSVNAHNIKFAASGSVAWTPGKILTIKHWQGGFNSSAGTTGRIYIGTTASGLTGTQVAQIHFADSIGNIYLATMLSTGELVAAAPTITTTVASYGPYCSNSSSSVSIPFTFTGPLSGTFKAQLSDASGTFTNDFATNIIGTGSSSPIAATIPAGLAPSTAYRIRIICQTPRVTFGSNNGSNITLTGYPTVAAITGAAVVTNGTSVTFSDATSGGVWGSSNASVASVSSTGVVSGVAAGNAIISYSVTNSCSLTTIVTFNIAVVNVPTILSISPGTALPGSTVTITGTNFDTSAAHNLVFFGAIRATVSAASATNLTVTIPSNASYAPLTLVDTTSVMTAISPMAFSPTYVNTGLIPDSVHFLPGVNFDAGTTPVGVVMADLDGDGRSDMVVTNSGTNTVYVYRNINTGSAISNSSFATPISLATGTTPNYVKIADLDGDGRQEIIVANKSTSSNKISVYHNNSVSGTLLFSTKVDFATTGAAPIDLAVADFDGDGKPDIAVLNQNSAKVSIFRNTSARGTISTSSFSVPVSFATGVLPFKIFAGDLDGDGKPDMAITNYTSGTLSIFHNTATTGSISATSFAGPATITTGTAPIGIAGGDIDGDGKTDLLVTNSGPNTFTIYRNTNTVAGALSFAIGISFNTGSDPADFALADIDGDGKTDIAVSNYSSNTVSIFRNTAISDTITAASLASPVDINTGAGPSGMALADMNGDGKADLAVVNNGASSVSVFRNYPQPPNGPISGPDSICIGSPTTLTDPVSGGYWSSKHPAIATVSPSGVVTGLTSGVDTIFYSTVAQGDSNTVFLPLTVEVYTTVGLVTGSSNRVCAGAFLDLSDSVASGYWTTSNAGIASVDSTGFVTGHAPGTAIITYSITNSCGTSRDTMNVLVTPSTGYVIGSISGGAFVCAGSSITFSDTTIGGNWVSSDTGVATVNASGTVRGISFGTALITYGFSGSCGIYQTTKLISVDTLLIADSIAGLSFVCEGANITLLNPAGTGGSWTVTNSHATVTGGVVHGVSAGIDTVIYAFTNSCGTTTVRKTITVNPLPHAGAISGATFVCIGAPITLTDTTFTNASAGIWGKTNAKANISVAGVVSGVNNGSDTIYYAVANSCGTDTARKAINILTLTAGTISGAISVCVGSSIALVDTTGGGSGTWSSLNSNASVSTTGVVTGVMSGTDTIIYTLPTVCGTAYAIKKITIYSTPTVAPILGPAIVCTGASITLTDTTTGGVWSKTNAKATVTNGVVHGVTAGVDTIIYTVTVSGCAASATKEVTIMQLSVGVISGATTLCAGSSIILKDSISGGIWSNTGNHSSFADSVFTATSQGKDTVSYTVTSACGSATATKIITINPLPFADSITGSTTVIAGDTILLKNSVKGGVWAATNTNAIITVAGSVGGLKPGTDTILYIVSNVCGMDTAYYPITIISADNTETITDINLYPNPTSGLFTVNVTSLINEKVDVLISNAVFQIMGLNTMNANTPTTISLNVPDGVYYVSIITKHSWNNIKLVIVH